MLITLLPLYRDEDLILCDMSLAKCYALIHSLAEYNGVKTVWADENESSQSAQMEKARSIIQSNFKLNNV